MSTQFVTEIIAEVTVEVALINFAGICPLTWAGIGVDRIAAQTNAK